MPSYDPSRVLHNIAISPPQITQNYKQTPVKDEFYEY